MQKIVIETINLTKIFRRKNGEKIRAVDKVNMIVREGEIVGILGPNGAGKTTLLRLLSGLLMPDEGTAIVCGYDIRKVRREINASCVYAMFSFQSLTKWFMKVIGRTETQRFLKIALGIMGLKCDSEDISDALRSVGLYEWRNEWPVRFSTGMLRKLDLAMALLVNHPILLMDEPTVHLDPLAAKEIRKVIRKIAEERNETIILTTQIMKDVEDLYDRVIFLKNGRNIKEGTPLELKFALKEELLRIIVRDVNLNYMDALKSLTSNTKFRCNENGKLTEIIALAPNDEVNDLIAEVVSLVQKIGGEIVAVYRDVPSLEDIFERLVT